jgi:hypothetical protein
LVVVGQVYLSMLPDFKAWLLAGALYPFERIQTVQQVQASYSNVAVRNSGGIVGICWGMQGRPCISEPGRTTEGSCRSSCERGC